ncbi:hypothetical protein I3842_05G222800 [Carya illinoinensis]|uniref:DUF8040 domain-containing protein n=1 Tax=Carya illinoinensis TaxID=32201 RepID=A0A922F7N7_CARIL|nr:hypothetical protein I3842_05G222800 [Carya illinoinensis]
MLVLNHCVFIICFFFHIFLIFFIEMENNGYNTQDYTSDVDNGKEEEKENDIDFMLALQLMVASKYYTTYSVNKPCRTSPHIGHKFVTEILNNHHDRCHQQFKMKKYVFHILCK